jgi:hypothetical protein
MPKITKLKATQNDDKESKTVITIVDKTDEEKSQVKKRKASTSPAKVRYTARRLQNFLTRQARTQEFSEEGAHRSEKNFSLPKNCFSCTPTRARRVGPGLDPDPGPGPGLNCSGPGRLRSGKFC